MVKRCICQICTCGRHRCPHRPFVTKQGGPCNLSEYHEEYRKKEAPRAENFKPPFQPIQHNGPLSDQTTNRVDYIKHPVGRPFVHQADPYKKPEGDLDTMTSYKKEYTPKEIAPVKAIRRDDARKVQGRFDGEPTYKSDYRKWQLPEKKTYHDPNTYQKSDAAFDGEPTYKTDYVKHPYAMRESLKPPENSAGNRDPFDGKTGYREDYIKHPLEARLPREKEAFKPPGVPLDDLTIHKQDFTPKEGGKQQSFKPDSTAFRSSDPLSDNTTFRNDYKNWPTNRVAAFKPDDYVKPMGDMDLRTTTMIEYDRKPMEPVKSMRPRERRPVTANFEDKTTNREDYKKWPLGERTRPSMKADYIAPGAPFDGISTFTAHYTPKPLELSRSFKPDSQQISSGPFDGTTMYRTDYVPKDCEPCPAAVLETGRSKYIFAEQSEAGHKFFAPAFETVEALPPRITGQLTAPKISNVAFA